jgi:cysteinyl-tRNA synthetase
MHLKVYNTLNKRLEAFVPQHPDRVSFYSCGPTVYDDAHIGNFRSFLAADLLRRWIESPLCTLKIKEGTTHTGHRTVLQVMNITDVGHMTDDENADGGGEDKMEVAARRIEQAKKSGTIPPDAGVDPSDPFAIARFYEARFKQDAIALGLKVAIDAQTDPSLMPRATDNIDNMKTVIEQLLKDGCAYPAGEPGARAIYFDVQKFQPYGQLSGNTIDHLRGGAGGRTSDSNTQQKHHPADFLLWKEDESHKMKWPSPTVPDQEPWGMGYPGWHIECTAMSLARLADGKLEGARKNHAKIDLHSGGEDNIFPHHECEIAQSCCFTGSDSFANYWFHPRFLKVEGQKMSKSRGTMYTLRDLTAKGIDPAAIRLELIKTHYRSNADFSMQGLKDSARTIERWRKFVEAGSKGEQGALNEPVREAVADAMNDDLNIAGALGTINKWIKDTPNPTQADAQLFEVFDHFLGTLSLKQLEQSSSDSGIALYQPGVTPSPEIESLLIARRDAKKAKDFAKADAIRDQLQSMGLAIMDKPKGQVEVAPLN